MTQTLVIVSLLALVALALYMPVAALIDNQRRRSAMTAEQREIDDRATSGEMGIW